MSMKENISIRATTQEKEQIEAYAKMHSVSVSALLKNLFFEKLENEYDLQLINESSTPYKTPKQPQACRERCPRQAT